MKFTVYQDRKKEWRWRLTAKNGRTIADSGEGYASKRNAVRAAQRMRDLLFAENVPIEEPQ